MSKLEGTTKTQGIGGTSPNGMAELKEIGKPTFTRKNSAGNKDFRLEVK